MNANDLRELLERAPQSARIMLPVHDAEGRIVDWSDLGAFTVAEDTKTHYWVIYLEALDEQTTDTPQDGEREV